MFKAVECVDAHDVIFEGEVSNLIYSENVVRI